jgi:predicted transcriptional regulator
MGLVMADENSANTVELATELTIAWLGNQNNRAVAEDVPAFLRTMHATLTALAGNGEDAQVAEPAAAGFEPAVSVRKSLASKEYILSLIDGKPFRTLKRHLSRQGLTPEQYRERYNLKPDYPMVAPAYSEQRRAMAMKIGLGAKGRAAKVPAKAPVKAPHGRGKAG